jgi:DNA-binding transcriptional regulator PaaX
MRKLKQLILFTLSSEQDIFSWPDSFAYKNYAYLYWRLCQFSPSSIRDGVLKLCDSGEVDKIVRNNTPLYRLTSQGRDRLLSFFPISIGQRRVWDRIWRIALIKTSIKGKDKSLGRSDGLQELREARNGLRELGFKKLASSVYITPLPVSVKTKDFCLKNQFINAQIAVIESRKLIFGDDKQIAKNIWGLDLINKQYQDIISSIGKLLKAFKKKKMLSDKAKKEFSLILADYFSLLKKDPGLPKKLLEADWPGDLARERFLKLSLKAGDLEKDLKG